MKEVIEFDRPTDGPALNTDGGGLSSNHPGMRGIFLLLSGLSAPRRIHVAGRYAKLAVAHGNGGIGKPTYVRKAQLFGSALMSEPTTTRADEFDTREFAAKEKSF